MFERLRFARYALRFERAYRTDRWEHVAACFRPDAVYSWEAAGETHGADAIVRLFHDLVTRYDKRFDRRIPRPAGVPRLHDGVLTVPWSVKYTSRLGDIVLHGTSSCRFVDGLIAELRDTMDADEVARWTALAERLTA